MEHFGSLQHYHQYMNWPAPEHPLFSVVRLAEVRDACRQSSPAITNDFYVIMLKYLLAGQISYGRTKLDFSQGTMIFNAPRQVIQWEDVAIEDKGFVITIHEDYLRGTPLAAKINTYGYFAYATNEALHLSPREEAIVTALCDNIEAEYRNNQDALSQEIILGLIDTILRYADRFYRRQFINRKEALGTLSTRFKAALTAYFASGKFNESGMPNVNQLASQLHVSPRYLSDALKAASGKTALEHIHLYLIDEAKNMLLEPGKTVAEVAYQLGFEYPQYFSRLFKNKVGVSPTSYRNKHQEA